MASMIVAAVEIQVGPIDFVATDPPYNPQLRLTMAGGPLAERHANRRTDYAMVSDDPAEHHPEVRRVLGREPDVGQADGAHGQSCALPE